MPEKQVARLVPDEPFPAYAFIPGRFPHPTSDPAGHSFGKEPPVPPPIDRERWQESRPYLYGIDLFNGGYYWESHVAWESLWIACGRKGTVADFLKGLIKLAAAGVKALEGKPEGVKSHWLYRECDQCLKPVCEKHSSEVEGRIICDRCRREAEAQQRSAGLIDLGFRQHPEPE